MTTTASPPVWATRAAHLVSLVVLPSGLWRLGIAAGLSMGLSEADTAGLPGWQSLYILALSLIAEGAALLTLGLVKPWGERFPPRLVAALGGTGAVALAFIWGFAFRNPDMPGIDFTGTGWEVLFYACYLPLLLWAPLLAAVTIDFYRRRVTRARGSGGRSWTGTPDTARRAHG